MTNVTNVVNEEAVRATRERMTSEGYTVVGRQVFRTRAEAFGGISGVYAICDDGSLLGPRY